VRSATQRHTVDIDEPQIVFVDQSRRLQGVPYRFALKMANRHAAELVVHERD
jgi:hypothetical protein